MAEGQVQRMRVLLAGGGTGGHVFPALAVARELEQRGCAVIWVGRDEGMERKLVEERGIEYRAVTALPWVGKSAIAKARALVTLGVSSLAARRLVSRSGVAVTLGTGGYVSAPAVVGSRLARRPVVLLEPNARAGAANRWLSRISTVACTGFESTGSELACRSYWTGVPVRADFFGPRDTERDGPFLLIVGGSQGARQINSLMPAAVERLSTKLERLTVVHQTGKADLPDVAEAYRRSKIRNVELELRSFIDDMASVMRRADLVVSRAGALTLAEIAAAGRPSILLPLAGAGGHQRDNARQLQAAGAAEVLDSGAVGSDELGTALETILLDAERRDRMGRAARELARPDAIERIADVVQVLGRAA